MGLFDFFSGDAQKKAAQARVAGLESAQSSASGAIDSGLSSFADYYRRAGDYYTPLATAASAGGSAYADATGVNGADGIARARQAFTSLPGYQEGLDSSVDLLERRANTRGQLGGGNLIADTTKVATDYANSKYGDYLSALAPYLGQQERVAGAQSGLTASIGSKAYDANALKGGIGYQTQQGIGNANADAALADYNANGNFWNTLLGAGKIAASMLI